MQCLWRLTFPILSAMTSTECYFTTKSLEKSLCSETELSISLKFTSTSCKTKKIVPDIKLHLFPSFLSSSFCLCSRLTGLMTVKIGYISWQKFGSPFLQNALCHERCNYLFECKNIKYYTGLLFRTNYCQCHVQLAEEVLFFKCSLSPPSM